jgi:hypothetical protein
MGKFRYSKIRLTDQNCMMKKLGKVRPRAGCEGPQGEQRHSSTVSVTLALDGDVWLMT